MPDSGESFTVSDSKQLKVIALISLALLAYFPLFSHLDSLTIVAWDESRLALNALEMYYNGDWLVTHFNGQPDLWNTKPPLMVWLQAGLMNIFGPTELALRLPSALATLGTCMLILRFCWQYLRNFWCGFFSVLFLITSSSYITDHCTRTGDYDALLIFFTVAYCLSFFLFLQTEKKKWIYLCSAGIVLAVFTKGIAGVMFLPGLFIIIFVLRKQAFVFKNKDAYLAALIFILFSSSWFIIREMASPGYVDAVWKNDMGGRYTEVIENHQQPFEYYSLRLFDQNLFAWAWIAVAGFAGGALHKNASVRNFSLLLIICSLSYLLFISLSATKTEWYSVPLFPFLAISAGIALSSLAVVSRISQQKNKAGILLFSTLLLIAVFLPEYNKILEKTQINPGSQYLKEAFYLPVHMRELAATNDSLENNIIWINHYAPDIMFYRFVITKKTGQEISMKNDNQLLPGDKVITQYNPEWEHLGDKYVYDSYYTANNLYYFTIREIK